MIAGNVAAVREKIAAACGRAGRSPGEVTLIAVSKTKPDEDVRAAYAAGCRDFGENYAQPLRDRAQALGDLAGVRWHMIGALQTNKAKYVASHAFAFHALDSADLARELGRRAAALGRRIECMIEVNVGGEAQKAGVAPDKTAALVQECATPPGLRVVGLMCIPPEDADPRPHFRALRALRDRLGLAHLSMGMTADYEAAVEEGATMVRVGTAIFGAR